jgi:predicted short-subunit dehydrogenase-like oxidoreductase (DUF2520 family)
VRAWDEAERAVRSPGAARDEGATHDGVATPGPMAAEPGDLPPGSHRHGDEIHHEDHPHPHVAADDEGRPVLGFIGAGPVGTALAVAFRRAGWPVGAVASRDAGRRDRFVSLVPGALAFADARTLPEACHLIFVTVPDDAISSVASSLRLYSGQAIVHTSGAAGAEVLGPALAAGTQAGSFHPLVAFADVEHAVEALHGATIAVEGEPPLAGLLAEMAEAVGGIPVRLPPGSKPAYHAAAVLAAAGVVSLLDAIAELARVAGLTEAQALAVYVPLMEGTLANARSLGISAALTGPMTRGDVGTLEAHAATLAAQSPEVAGLYRELTLRAITIATARGAIDGATADRLRAALAGSRAP